MARKGAWAAAVYPAAELFVDRSLRGGASFVTGAVNVWTQAPTDDFYQRFVVNESVGAEAAGGFSERLVAQLEGASTETVLLAADLACLSALPASDMAHETKLKRLQTILGAVEPSPEIDPVVLEAFKTGIASYGAGHAVVWKYMQYLADFARAWVSLGTEERIRRLEDPWEWKEFVVGRPGGTAGQAAALLHLVFPEVFEPIVSADARAAIVKTFARVPGVEDETDVDRKLLLVRSAIEPVLGTTFHFWSPAVEPVWRSGSTDRAWEFAQFALDFLKLESFEDMEMTYKLKAASRLHEARRAVLDSAADWIEPLKAAFGGGQNITNWRQHDSFVKWCEAEQDASHASLAALWSAESADTADLDAFLTAVPEQAIASPGARANVLAYLLGAWDPSEWVNYKATQSDRALSLCGREVADTGDVVGRISSFKQFVDELRVRVVALGGPATTRLEAQGMAWCVTTDFVPDEWPKEKQEALTAFRGGVSGPEPPPPATEIRAWFFRGFGFPDGSRSETRWVEEGFVSTFWAELGPIDSGTSMEELATKVKEAYPEDSPGRLRTTVGSLFRFATSMGVGDLVVTTLGAAVYVGRVTGESRWESDSHPWVARRRSVEWLNTASPASREELSPALLASLRMPSAVGPIAQANEVAALVGLAPKPSSSSDVTLPSVTPEVAERVFFDVGNLQEIVELLSQKKQLVFFGPPGTGKTLVAQRLAEHLTAAGGDWRLAQFHPSYSYEDFMEGYRPTTSAEGNVSYELREGPLRRIAADARNDPTKPYVLIVDEINRGNIPKIFGELLFLLEYRATPITLQYSEEQFDLPPNLFLIGTMNTADRSIALVDAALRRRFFFVPFLPREEPVSRVLRRWLESKERHHRPALFLDALNQKLAKDEISIGPSYLMTGDGSDESLRRIWRYSIMPLLEEHYYGTKHDAEKEFGFDACRVAIDGVVEVIDEAAVMGEAEDPTPAGEGNGTSV
jgi:hypothetical protein